MALLEELVDAKFWPEGRRISSQKNPVEVDGVFSFEEVNKTRSEPGTSMDAQLDEVLPPKKYIPDSI